MGFSESALNEFLTVDLPITGMLAHGVWVDIDDVVHRAEHEVTQDTVRKLRGIADDVRDLATGIDLMVDRLERGSEDERPETDD